MFPVSTPDRLALVNAAGLPTFRPAFDALVSMGFYNQPFAGVFLSLRAA
ncbi:MAG: hypothetical protein V5B39_00010 [Accumulibacter sp.]